MDRREGVEVSDLPDDPAYLEGRAAGWETGYEACMERTRKLVACAQRLVELLDDAEVNHGGLYSTVTLRGRNDLRLELSKWK